MSEAGETDCPYCLARRSAVPVEGTRLTFLSGPHANRCGVVVADRWGTCPSGSFLVRMDYEESGSLRITSPYRDTYVTTDQLVIPTWLLPLSTQDNFEFHETLIKSLAAIVLARTRVDFCQALAPVILQCWQGRFPVSAQEVWAVLAAHRAPHQFEEDAVMAFNLGIELLTLANARPAVKRRRMQPMSKGRYLTAAQRALWMTIFGHE